MKTWCWVYSWWEGVRLLSWARICEEWKGHILKPLHLKCLDFPSEEVLLSTRDGGLKQGLLGKRCLCGSSQQKVSIQFQGLCVLWTETECWRCVLRGAQRFELSGGYWGGDLGVTERKTRWEWCSRGWGRRVWWRQTVGSNFVNAAEARAGGVRRGLIGFGTVEVTDTLEQLQ